MLEDVHDFAMALNLSSFVLIGMSMGGGVSVALSAKYPSAVKALVLVDWALETKKEGRENLRRIAEMQWSSFDEAVQSVLKTNPRRSRENIENRLKFTIHEKEPGKWMWKVDTRAMNRQQDLTPMWEGLQKITCPTLLLKGKQSDILSDETALKVKGCIKDCTLVEIENAGHSVAGDNPQAFYEEVIKFLVNNNSRL